MKLQQVGLVFNVSVRKCICEVRKYFTLNLLLQNDAAINAPTSANANATTGNIINIIILHHALIGVTVSTSKKTFTHNFHIDTLHLLTLGVPLHG